MKNINFEIIACPKEIGILTVIFFLAVHSSYQAVCYPVIWRRRPSHG